LLFVNAVASGRKMTAQSVSALADGRGWIAQQALDKGFIDEVMPLDDAVAGFMQGVLRGSKPLTPDGDQPRPTMAPRSRAVQKARPVIQLSPEQQARTEWRRMSNLDRSKWIDAGTYVRQRSKEIVARRAAR
jgi:ClpP class serine protease